MGLAGPVRGIDVIATLRELGPPDADPDLIEAWLDPDMSFDSLAELERECPPERIGLSEGAYAALFGPLFGEFE